MKSNIKITKYVCFPWDMLWFAGEWPSMMNDLHITVKELFPIVLALDIMQTPPFQS
jgi:hypothetical protein